MSSTDLRSLLGLSPSSSAISDHITRLSRLVNSVNVAAVAAVKSYPDTVYLNYFSLGLSLQFVPTKGYKPAVGAERAGLEEDKLVLDSIDIYNASTAVKNTSERTFSPYPLIPFTTVLKDGTLQVAQGTTGKEFVQVLGEPERKGGGSGPSNGSIGIWCEWTKEGTMIEFGGDDARGPQAWERGKDAVWRVMTIFRHT